MGTIERSPNCVAKVEPPSTKINGLGDAMTMCLMTQDLADSESEVALMDMEETIVFEPQPPDPNQGPEPESAEPRSGDDHSHDRAKGPSVMPAAIPSPSPNAQANRYAYSSGARPLEGYTIKRAIGRGGFGEVYYATSDSGKEVALKLVVRNLDVERRGVSQCMNLKCANLLSIHDLRANDAGDTFVIMEYVAGPSLANVLASYPNGMPVAEIRAWMKGLVEGVVYLHDHGIVHRDLKPANLFMEEGVVKIGDYGLAKLITPSADTGHSESIGTCHYMAPEIASGKYNKPVDIYAMGVILFEMITGHVPFEGETVGEVLMKHLTSRPDLSMLPEPYRTIVAKALSKDPAHRPKSPYELLTADDAPKTPNVRFIGDGKNAPRLPEVDAAAPVNGRQQPNRDAKPDDDILRINAEEPIFYIGPDTKPTPPAPPRGMLNQRLRENWAVIRQDVAKAREKWRAANPPKPPLVRQATYRPQPQPQPRPVKPVARKPAPVVAPVVVPPPEPSVLPSLRARVAELASSMVWTAPVAAILALVTGLSMGFDPSRQPEHISFLFGMTLLGTWVNLGSARLLEGWKLDRYTSRTITLGLGMLTGLAGAAYAHAINLGTVNAFSISNEFGPILGPKVLPTPLAFAMFFGLANLLGSLPNYAARDRRSRIRVLPLAKVAAVGLIAGGLLAFPLPWGVAIPVLMAVVTEIVSPWDKNAARYAKYVAKQAKISKKKMA